ncbi:ferredoxin [Yimella sp. cx-51]|nr:ferredoxin [Yimella sp. cx-51]QTH37845.1 ferredoxin [Yimella sp. cx-51]
MTAPGSQTGRKTYATRRADVPFASGLSPLPTSFGSERSSDSATLHIDRIACTGHGLCAALLPEQVSLDEWGYPVVHAQEVDADLGRTAVRLCPVAALRLGVR